MSDNFDNHGIELEWPFRDGRASLRGSSVLRQQAEVNRISNARARRGSEPRLRTARPAPRD
jgi:hypothetical protein